MKRLPAGCAVNAGTVTFVTWPVRSFVALCFPPGASCPVATPNKRRASTALPKTSLHRPKRARTFYSSATPRVQLLKHLLTSRHRGTTPAAPLLPGLVMIYVSRPGLSAGPSVGHVARGSDPQLTPVCIELPFDHSFRESNLGLSDFGEPN